MNILKYVSHYCLISLSLLMDINVSFMYQLLCISNISKILFHFLYFGKRVMIRTKHVELRLVGQIFIYLFRDRTWAAWASWVGLFYISCCYFLVRLHTCTRGGLYYYCFESYLLRYASDNYFIPCHKDSIDNSFIYFLIVIL